MVIKPMESPPSSNLSFYDLHDQAGVAIPTPVEGRNCGIAVNVPKELWPRTSLRLGNQPLPIFQSDTIAYSEWPPCSSGNYELILECDGVRENRTVTVMPRYFSENEFKSIVHDLTETIPTAIATRLNECGAHLALPKLDNRSSIEEEYLSLRRAVQGTKDKLGMLQILPMLQRDCHQILIPQHELRSTNKVRRPDISKLAQAIAMPGNIASNDRVYEMFDITVEKSFEAYENRLVKAYGLALRSRLSRLQSELRAAHAPPAMTAELEALTNEFTLAFNRATFLREVRNPTISSVRVTMVLLKNPAYRAVLEGYLALNDQSSSSVSIEEPALNAPLNNFPYLYQRWANLNVLSALLQVCAESGYRCENHQWVRSYHRSTKIQVITDGRPAVQLSCARTGRVVSFLPWSATGGTVYIVGQEVPMGAAVTIQSEGKPLEILLFDPKYWVDSKKAKDTVDIKASGNAKPEEQRLLKLLSAIEPLKEDVDGVQRAIDYVKSAGGASEIKYAAILYPGQHKQPSSNIEALPAHPNSGANFHKSLCVVFRRHLS